MVSMSFNIFFTKKFHRMVSRIYFPLSFES